MTKRTIFATIAVALIAGVSIFVACTKEENKSNTVNIQVFQKTETDQFVGYLDNAYFAVKTIYRLADSAYSADSVTFMTACNTNNLDDFYSIIGLSQTQIEALTDAITEDANYFAVNHPEYPVEEEPCSDCVSSALPNLGAAVSARNGHLTQALSEDCKGCIFACALACVESGFCYPVCVAVCSGICCAIVNI